jgi:hypothetical protein
MPDSTCVKIEAAIVVLKGLGALYARRAAVESASAMHDCPSVHMLERLSAHTASQASVDTAVRFVVFRSCNSVSGAILHTPARQCSTLRRTQRATCSKQHELLRSAAAAVAAGI